jgi:hypothetical protein
MNSEVLILRDANWFTDYPTAALYAEYLYSYTSSHSVDGVIAFDQQALVEILQVVGPIQVEGASELVDANNVIAFMRASKTPTDEERADPNWSNKVFINNITRALLNRIFEGNLDWTQFSRAIFKVLEEHHLLVQVDNTTMTPLLVKHGWDGSVRPGAGDFLMVVDSNVGFNKTNAVVSSSLSYEANLEDTQAPFAKFSASHTNNAKADVPCLPFGYLKEEDIKPEEWQEDYPIDRCFWDYLRFYTVTGAEVLSANPQTIPAENIASQLPVAPQVDVLEEDYPGVDGFGILKLVPGGETVESNFRYSLPAAILRSGSESGSWVYHLRVQKQPGTLAVPIVIRVVLPKGAEILIKPEGATSQENVIVLETNLLYDLELDFVFRIP